MSQAKQCGFRNHTKANTEKSMNYAMFLSLMQRYFYRHYQTAEKVNELKLVAETAAASHFHQLNWQHSASPYIINGKLMASSEFNLYQSHRIYHCKTGGIFGM